MAEKKQPQPEETAPLTEPMGLVDGKILVLPEDEARKLMKEWAKPPEPDDDLSDLDEIEKLF